MSGSAKSTTSRWLNRRVAAVVLCPLGVAPLLAVAVWDGMEMSSGSLVATVWEYSWTGLIASYVIAAHTGVVVWWLLAITKIRPPAWLFIALYTAACSVVGMLLAQSLSGAMAGPQFGLLTAVAYCLIAGVPWRVRRPSESPKSPEVLAG